MEPRNKQNARKKKIALYQSDLFAPVFNLAGAGFLSASSLSYIKQYLNVNYGSSIIMADLVTAFLRLLTTLISPSVFFLLLTSDL